MKRLNIYEKGFEKELNGSLKKKKMNKPLE